MNNEIVSSKKAEITMRLSEFEMPPMQDVLIVGKKAPIGPEAARRMVDILTPDQYEILRVDHANIEAVVLRKTLLMMLPQEKLVPLLLEEGEKIANKTSIIKVQVSVVINVSKSVDL